MTVQFVVPTKRRKMTQARAASIFLREQGRCYLCLKQLRLGVDKYEIEHPKALSLGGSDDDADLRVVCTDCHPPKTKADAGAKAKRDRIVTAGWNGARKSSWGKQRLGNGNNQHKATSPILWGRKHQEQPQ
jgi:5-methylcytosine-specific restriction endonuclease McrA